MRFAIQNSSLILPPTRAESTFVPYADGCYKSLRYLRFCWLQIRETGCEIDGLQTPKSWFRSRPWGLTSIFSGYLRGMSTPEVWFHCYLLLVKEEMPHQCPPLHHHATFKTREKSNSNTKSQRLLSRHYVPGIGPDT